MPIEKSLGLNGMPIDFYTSQLKNINTGIILVVQ